MIVRNLSPSRLRKLLTPFFLTTYTHTRPVPNSLHSLIIDPSPSPAFPFSQYPAKTLPFFIFSKPFSSESGKNKYLPNLPLSRDGNYEEATEQALAICPGCGIQMQEQDVDPKQHGYSAKPSAKGHNYKKFKKMTPILDESEISDSLKRGIANDIVDVDKIVTLDTVDNMFDETSKRLEKEAANQKPIVCARCHSLRHYQKVKEPGVENLLPDFDFDHTVGRRLMSISGARTVVLLVVDAADFDGSFPRKVANLVSKTIDENARSWKEGKSGNIPRIVLVVTKIDLLPSSISPTRLEHWVRVQAREGGAGKLTSVHLVSAVRDWGVKTLVDDVVSFAGPRGHVWAVGAQNAGKSTLINAIGKCVGTKATHVTEASVPGTTLGIVRMEGVLPGKAKLFDTPGLLHPHQISTRLTAEEQKLCRIDKELRPRTYRIKAGYSVHIGGLFRLDVEESTVDSLYVTVWASSLIPLHMGRMEKACLMLEEHFGRQLQPPIGEGRVEKLGKWVKKEIRVCGERWDSSSIDIAAAGLGWFAVGLKGEATLAIWTYDGVEVTARNALLPERAKNFEVAGFTVSEIVSKADRARSKQSAKKRKSSSLKNAASPASSASNVDEDSNSDSSASIPSCSSALSSSVLNIDEDSNSDGLVAISNS